ncbi:MAG: hypothetical protein ACE15C_14935 [Phycisphaerae bacterium]
MEAPWQRGLSGVILAAFLTVALPCALSERADAAIAVGLNFTGVTYNQNTAMGTGAVPPDTMGAIGPDKFVEFVNGAFAVFDKGTGLRLSLTTDQRFWASAGIDPGANNLSDPRIVYDKSTNTWFASEITIENTNNRVLVARSSGPDPTGPWKAVSFLGNAGGRGKFLDFDTLGVDANGVYVGGNMFTSSVGTFNSVSLFSIPKIDLLAATPTTSRMTRFDALSASTYGFALQPVVNFSPSAHAAVMAIDNTSSTLLNRTSINGAGGAGATLSAETNISVASFPAPPPGIQPDGTNVIDTGDDRFSASVVQVGDFLYMAHAILSGNSAAIRWTKINETTNTVVQEGTIADQAYDAYYPSIAANANGDVVIGFNRSGTGSTDFISSYVAVGRTAGGTLTFDAPVKVKAGLSNYHLQGGSSERWGDYSATTVDPNDPCSFWTIQEIPLASNNWGTQITQFNVNQWAGPGGGSYQSTSNWTGGTAASAVDGGADFYANITGPAVVTIDAPVTLGIINFSSPNSYTLAGTGPITLQASYGLAMINSHTGSHFISAPLVLASTAAFTVDGGGSLTISGPISGSAGLTKAGPGALVLSATSTFSGPITHNNGTLTISGAVAGGVTVASQQGSFPVLTGGGVIGGPLTVAGGLVHPTGILTAGSASFATAGTASRLQIDITGGNGAANARPGIDYGRLAVTGTADVHNADLRVNISPGLNLLGDVLTVVTTTSNLTGTSLHSVDFMGTGIADVTATAGGVALSRIAYPGDANRDGIVDMADYVIWFNNFGQTGMTWDQGDFDGEGLVDMADYVLWFANFGSDQNAGVPEPATAVLLALSGLAILRRGRP